LVVSACGSTPAPEPIQPIEIRTSPVARPNLVLPPVDTIQTRSVQWVIITSENYEEVFAKLQKDGNDMVLIGLTGSGYENLSLNLNDLRTFIEQQNAVIIAYRNYYIRSQQALSGAVVVQ
jgi:hypothetical protein